MKLPFMSFVEIIEIYGNPYYSRGKYYLSVKVNADYIIRDGVFKGFLDDCENLRVGSFIDARKTSFGFTLNY